MSLTVSNAEKLEGGAGDDTFQIKQGAAWSGTLDGGDGDDIISYAQLVHADPYRVAVIQG